MINGDVTCDTLHLHCTLYGYYKSIIGLYALSSRVWEFISCRSLDTHTCI